MLLMQGAFMDRDRGALDAVRAMVHLPDAHLALIGAGRNMPRRDRWPTPRGGGPGPRPRTDALRSLRRCTAAADIGLSLDRPTVDNFRFSLPNKLFDFLHAGLPVVCSDLPVAGRFVRENATGEVALSAWGDEAIAQEIAQAVRRVLSSPPAKDLLAEVAERHHWEAHAETVLRAIHHRPD